ncbi:MAG TPA: TonB-dependent receptor, partial [Thermoanaerobaculia bacterium]|nr:TonB-dependent receptor [Thermoanaerobaculia bacterium]
MRRFVALSIALYCVHVLGISDPALLYAQGPAASGGPARQDVPASPGHLPAAPDPATTRLATAVVDASGGTLEGTVHTLDGTPVPHLVLVLDGPSGSRTLITGPTGRYRATGLDPGSYRLAPRSQSFVVAREDAGAAAPAVDGRLDLVVAPRTIEERIVVTATRGDAIAAIAGVATSVLDRQEIRDRGAASVLDLLGGLPGLTAARTGGVGSQGSIFVRGGESDFVRVLVDGVPLNEPGGAYDFGPMLPLELERIEIVRGAASALYGTDALAGVLHLVTRRGARGAPAIRLEGEAGSEDWERALAGASGATERLDWSLALQSLETANETPNNAFDSETGALTAGVAPSAATSLRLMLRSSDSRVGTPGPVRFGRPDLDAYFDRKDVAAGVTGSLVRGEVEHELYLGWASSDQLSVNPLDSGPYVPRLGDVVSPFTFFDFPNAEGFLNDTQRLSTGYRSELRAGERHIVTAGIDFERETGKLGDRRFDLLEPERENWGVYVQDRVLAGDRVFVTAGGRLEQNESFGTRFVPRLALAWESARGDRVVRASAGAGIKEPSFPESYGVSFFARGNPDLEPEESRTYELGVAQTLGEGSVRLEGALFLHEYENQVAFELLDFETFEGSFVNLGRSRGRGLELSLEAKPAPPLRVVAHYTYLDGEILVSGNAFSPIFAAGRSLLRRPEHEGTLLVEGSAGRFHPGARLLVVGRRADTDFSGLDLEESP